MTPDQVRNLYDQQYADSYDQTFREGPIAASMTKSEKKILKLLLSKGGPWLDVGCGTGFSLAQFPHIERTGLDLSPAMLKKARAANQTANFIEGNFLDPRPEWNGRFRLVTCMWYAYALLDSVREIECAIDNMADWTTDTGFLFVPVCDPRAFGTFPERQPWWGGADEVQITAVVWNYTDSHQHLNLVSPTLEVMRGMLRNRFHTVTDISYEITALLAADKK
jgi:SAM-dependent methyltransferase